MSGSREESLRVIGRYAVCGSLASGATATVHVGRMLEPVQGFSRVVAVKRANGRILGEARTVFVDEARIASRVRHANVVQLFDVVDAGGDVSLVMEYVHGESLARLLSEARRRGESMPAEVAASVFSGVLHGLHAAHDARDAQGNLLSIVHRDVSPQNILVGVDGLARLVDFGIAKAVGRLQRTSTGFVKGKIAYMSPEQLR